MHSLTQFNLPIVSNWVLCFLLTPVNFHISMISVLYGMNFDFSINLYFSVALAMHFKAIFFCSVAVLVA